MHYDNFNEALTTIELAPKQWDQSKWYPWCGSGCCIAGHTVLLSGRELPTGMFSRREQIPKIAAELLDIHGEQRVWLFSPIRTLDEFRLVRRVHATSRLIAAAAK